MTLPPTGKSLRALQALKDTTPDTAMTARGVWLRVLESDNNYPYAALATLVEHGLAARVEGRPARWYITDAGAALLAEEGR